MADIPLRKYLGNIEALIDKQQVEEAVAHCRHILSYYPKHIDTYRILGKALLEKGRHGDAADIFQRVLSSVPDDFVAHVGMSIVREDEANVEAAIWHMERAFEANPSNGPIQEELRRLYGRRDGVVPPKARLTRGAVARMYAKGELYPQAEAELKAALSADPERVDLATVLANVYWHSEQRAEAATTCNNILQKLPYSQEANRIVAALLQEQGRANDAAPYRQRLEALDPYEAHTDPSHNGQGAAHVNPDVVRIAPLDYVPGMGGEGAAGSPDWMASLGEKFETPAAASSNSTPDWLRDSPMAESTPAAEMAAASDMPDWMKDMQPSAESPVASDLSFATTTPEASAGPDWLSDIAAAPAVPADDMPDWLKSATGPLNANMIGGQPQTETPQPAAPAPTPTAAEDVPDWIKPATGPLAEAELPDWMKAAAPPVPTPAIPPPPSAPAADDVPDWMKPATGRLSTDELPDWMKAGIAPAVPSPATPPPPSRPTAPTAQEEVPDWMKSALGSPERQPKGEETAEPAPPASAAPTPADEIPDWMKAATETPSAFVETTEVAETDLAAMSGDEAMSWLEGLAKQQGARPEELVSQPPVAAAPEPSEPEPPAAEAIPLDELPAWMRPALPQGDASRSEAEGDAAPLPTGEPSSAAAATGGALAVPGTTPLSIDSLPDWMKPAGADALADRRVQPSPVEEAEEAAPTPLDELPVWMRSATSAGAASPTGSAAPASAPAEEKPDWLKQMEAEADQFDALSPGQPPAPATEAAPEIDLPDWMRAAPSAVEEPALPQEGASRSEAEGPVLPQGGASRSEAEGTTLFSTPSAATPTPAEEKPDWLKQMEAEADQFDAMTQGQPAAPGEPKPKATAKLPVELPDFLQPATPEAIARANEPTHLADETEGEKENWLAEVITANAPPVAAQAGDAEVTPAEVGELPDWIKAMAPPAEPATPAAPAIPPEPSLSATAIFSAPEASIPTAAPEPTATAPSTETAQPDLASMDSDEAMRWLEGLALQQGGKPEEMVAQPSAAEAPEWLRPPSAEAATGGALAETSPSDVPTWVEPQAPGPSDSVADWLAGKKAPEWLRQPGEAAPMPPTEWLRAPVEEDESAAEGPRSRTTGKPAEELPEWLKQPEAALTEPAVPAADSGAMSDDDALRWLEGLAAQQGAKPEELVASHDPDATRPLTWMTTQPLETKPEPALAPQEDLPDFLRRREPEVQPAEPEVVAAPAEEIPDWLKQMEATPAEPTPSIAEAPAQPEADLSAMSAEAALRWLEGLAAQQGAKPEELVTRPEERTAQPPTWITEQSAESEDEAEAVATPSEEIPDWLKQMEAAPAEPTPPEVESPAQPEADLSSMSAEDAMRWLEGLAAQQGARPEELVTRPEERITQPPTWITAQPAEPEVTAIAPPVAAEPPQRAGMASRPPTLAAAREEPEAPAAATGSATTGGAIAVAVTPPQAEADLGAMSAEDALRWLEGLAAQQGAKPEELITLPEERTTQPPTWVTAQPAEAAAEPAPKPTRPVSLPPTLAAALEEPEAPAAAPIAFQPGAPAPKVEAPAAPPPQPEETSEEGPTRLSRLAEKLAATKRAREAEIAARFDAQRSQQEAARLEVQKKMEEKRSVAKMGTGRLGTGPLGGKPGTGPLGAGTGPLGTGMLGARSDTGQLGAAESEPAPATGRLTPPQPVERPAPRVVSQPASKPRPKGPVRPRGRAAKSPYAAEPPDNVLAIARQHIAEDNHEHAAEALGYLVATGQRMDDVIADLEEHVARRQATPPLLRVLGDAYMRNNRLQKALDTYRLALGQL